MARGRLRPIGGWRRSCYPLIHSLWSAAGAPDAFGLGQPRRRTLRPAPDRRRPVFMPAVEPSPSAFSQPACVCVSVCVYALYDQQRRGAARSGCCCHLPAGPPSNRFESNRPTGRG
uniref:Uncharacterized protein n=1 Tax=Plectus sambesii TaxID=2011161 RepID=A0A914UTF6_9BILA